MSTTQYLSTADRRMRRIQKVSRILRAVLLAFLVFVAIGAVTAVILLATSHHPSPVKYQMKRGDFSFTFDVNFDTKPWEFIPTALIFMVALNFFRLFSRLKDGHLFEGQTIRYLERGGKWWIALGIAQIIFKLVGPYFSSADNASWNLNLNDGWAADILCGLVVFFIAWLLREGQKLKEEQELTV